MHRLSDVFIIFSIHFHDPIHAGQRRNLERIVCVITGDGMGEAVIEMIVGGSTGAIDEASFAVAYNVWCVCSTRGEEETDAIGCEIMRSVDR